MKKEKKIEQNEKVVAVEKGVNISVNGMRVSVKGPKGEISRDFSDPRFENKVKIVHKGDTVCVESSSDVRKVKAFVGTLAAHIKNMMYGVTKGYRYEMGVVYTHFPITFEVEKDRLVVKNFLGEKGNRFAKLIGTVHVKADKTKIVITGINKEEVAQTAANIEQACLIKGRDRRVFQDGVYINIKEFDVKSE